MTVQQPTLVTMTEGVAGFTVPLAGGLTVTYHPSVVVSLRQVMAHLGEGSATVTIPDQMARLAFRDFSQRYLKLRELGLLLGPDANELAAYYQAVNEGNQVKMPRAIELTALGERLNQAGEQLYKQCTMTASDYASSSDETLVDTE